MAQPGISDAQVFGIPDEHFGEAVCAWVIPAPGGSVTAEDVTTLCKGQIAHFKVPKHIAIVETFPMTVTGKPQKFIMRDQMLETLKAG